MQKQCRSTPERSGKWQTQFQLLTQAIDAPVSGMAAASLSRLPPTATYTLEIQFTYISAIVVFKCPNDVVHLTFCGYRPLLQWEMVSRRPGSSPHVFWLCSEAADPDDVVTQKYLAHVSTAMSKLSAEHQVTNVCHASIWFSPEIKYS